MAVQSGKFLTFALGEEEYGIPIQSVKEINGIMDITIIPKMPKFMKGVINLRGKIIPVIDLRLKFALEELVYSQRTCIIVVEVGIGDSAKRLMGIVVDTVSEVVNILPTDIEEPPVFEYSTDISFITGMGKVKGKVVMLLDIAKVLDTNEISIIKNINVGGMENA